MRKIQVTDAQAILNEHYALFSFSDLVAAIIYLIVPEDYTDAVGEREATRTRR